MNSRRDIELALDSPSSSGEGSEVISPMVAGRSSPTARPQKQQSKILMMSTTDRESLSNRSSSTRAPIAHKKPSWEKTCRTYGSMCMAIFLFAGGIVRSYRLSVYLSGV